MNADQRLADHEGHRLAIRVSDDGMATLECDTCGEYIIEQDAEGMVLFG